MGSSQSIVDRTTSSNEDSIVDEMIQCYVRPAIEAVSEEEFSDGGGEVECDGENELTPANMFYRYSTKDTFNMDAEPICVKKTTTNTSKNRVRNILSNATYSRFEELGRCDLMHVILYLVINLNPWNLASLIDDSGRTLSDMLWRKYIPKDFYNFLMNEETRGFLNIQQIRTNEKKAKLVLFEYYKRKPLIHDLLVSVYRNFSNIRYIANTLHNKVYFTSSEVGRAASGKFNVEYKNYMQVLQREQAATKECVAKQTSLIPRTLKTHPQVTGSQEEDLVERPSKRKRYATPCKARSLIKEMIKKSVA